MTVLFTISNITEKQETHLKERFPNQNFVFLKDKKLIPQYIEEAEIFVTYGKDVTEELLKQAKNLKWIQVLAAGVDPLPFDAIKKNNILVTNVRGIHKIPMSEYAISMILSVYRKERDLLLYQLDKHWDRTLSFGEVTGKTMIVLGTGSIGQEVARLAKAFRMKTIGVSRSGRDKEHFDEVYSVTHLHSVLDKGDFIVSVLPSTKETRYLLKDEHFDLMRDDAIFLNMGRGDLVKTETLVRAVQEEKIGHLILDVFEEEPLAADSPLWKNERVTITPHIAAISDRYLERALGIFKENMNLYEDRQLEEMLNVIDLDRGY